MDAALPAHLTPEALLVLLTDLGIETVLHRHPPLRTVEDSRRLRGDIPGAHVKNLFLKDKRGGLWLATAHEDTVIDLKAAARALEAARLSFGSAELLEAVLGIRPGAVSPLALINDRQRQVRFLLDPALEAAGLVNLHPLTNEMTLTMSSMDLRRFLGHTGHEARPLPL